MQKELLLKLLNTLAERCRSDSHEEAKRNIKPTTIIIDRLDTVSVEPGHDGKRERPSGDDLLGFVRFWLEAIGGG